MSPSSIHVHDVQVRAPGLSREQGRLLGEAIAQRLASLAPSEGGNHNIPHLAIRVHAPPSTATNTLASRIVAGIHSHLP